MRRARSAQIRLVTTRERQYESFHCRWLSTVAGPALHDPGLLLRNEIRINRHIQPSSISHTPGRAFLPVPPTVNRTVFATHWWNATSGDLYLIAETSVLSDRAGIEYHRPGSGGHQTTRCPRVLRGTRVTAAGQGCGAELGISHGSANAPLADRRPDAYRTCVGPARAAFLHTPWIARNPGAATPCTIPALQKPGRLLIVAPSGGAQTQNSRLDAGTTSVTF